MKRFLYIILSMYLLSLTVIPCSDSIVSMCQNQIEDTHAHDNPNSADNHDNCSPFCVCNCCKVYGVSQLLGDYFPNSDLKYIQSENYPIFDFPICHNDSLDVWQPPQLV
ncbi:DUF6660 family protein [Sphingobacterium bovistauri]|uniref:Uncharacterized protein n=1 Tax=Sphingobacterium bovistauri TaxID=2781959 RepID=A0ABS7Z047_9SPHI|nr:DUF6660 family protein [Sphingobacterium bovistauri]MCA5003540.1 hypothetical protein [Sphingobacterium bovistauri]